MVQQTRTYDIRALDPVTDEAMFKQAFEWIFTKPHWFQYTDGVVQIAGGIYTYDDYITAARDPSAVDYGLFDSEGQLHAVYTIQDRGRASFQVHVNTPREIDRMALIAGAAQLRDWLFQNGALEIFGLIASINRPMRKFAEQAGFSYCGVSIFKGSLNNRPIRWLRYHAAR